MKMRLPIFILAIVLIAVIAILSSAHADIIGTGPAPVIVPTTTPSPVYYHLGALNLTVPWDEVNVVYLYDLQGKRNMVGGETVVATLWRLQGTLGAVTSLDGIGAPFVGGNLWFSNPLPQIAILGQIKPGIFGGYDFNKSSAMFGFKASMPIFN